MSLGGCRVLIAFGRVSSKISFLRTFIPLTLFDYSLIAITSSCITTCTHTHKWSGRVKATPVPSRQKQESVHKQRFVLKMLILSTMQQFASASSTRRRLCLTCWKFAQKDSLFYFLSLVLKVGAPSSGWSHVTGEAEKFDTQNQTREMFHLKLKTIFQIFQTFMPRIRHEDCALQLKTLTTSLTKTKYVLLPKMGNLPSAHLRSLHNTPCFTPIHPSHSLLSVNQTCVSLSGTVISC